MAATLKSTAANAILAANARRKQRAAAADDPAGTVRSWGTAPRPLPVALRGALIAQLRELRMDLDLVAEFVRASPADGDAVSAKRALEALAGLVDDYTEILDIAADWRKVVG